MARLVLIGLPGAGKSTVAQAMAERWGCSWVDTDDIIAESVGRPAAELLREEGEPVFRDHELVALEAALGTDSIVATGGGVVSIAAARELLKSAPTIWLDCDEEVLLDRLTDGERPLLENDPRGSLARLRATRNGWYREVSRARVEASGTLEDVTERIVTALAGAEQ